MEKTRHEFAEVCAVPDLGKIPQGFAWPIALPTLGLTSFPIGSAFRPALP